MLAICNTHLFSVFVIPYTFLSLQSTASKSKKDNSVDIDMGQILRDLSDALERETDIKGLIGVEFYRIVV